MPGAGAAGRLGCAWAGAVSTRAVASGSGIGGNTNLTGAVIASDAPAANNILTTNTLTFSNILNQANYSATTVGVSLSSNASAVATGLSAAGSGLGLLGSSGSASGTTQAAISAGTVTVLADAATGGNSLAGLSRDTAGANGNIQQIFNLQQIQNDQAIPRVWKCSRAVSRLRSNSVCVVWELRKAALNI